MDNDLLFVNTVVVLIDTVIQAYPMPVASYMDTDILCLMRLIGMCILDKHIRSQAAYLREAQYILRKQVHNTVDTSDECQLRTILLLAKVQYLIRRSVCSNINTMDQY